MTKLKNNVTDTLKSSALFRLPFNQEHGQQMVHTRPPCNHKWPFNICRTMALWLVSRRKRNTVKCLVARR